MIRAAIAIGSNSTRMLVADKTNGHALPLLRGREETRLFLGLTENGMISPDALENTAQAVKRLQAQALALGARQIALFATSAARDAKNSGAFAARIYELTHLSLRVISGTEEARLAFKAAAGNERRLVMDIGGGSTEMTVGENGQIEYSCSAQMGAGRLAKMCEIHSLPDAERARDIAREVLLPYAEQIGRLPHAPVCIGLGGTCTAAVSIARGRELHGDDADDITVSKAQLEAQWKMLAPMSLEERARVPGLPPTRALLMPTGLSILCAAMDLLHFDRVTSSGRNNLDGFMMEAGE